MNCPHILRYLTAAAILHKRRKNVLKDLVRVLLQSTHDVLPAPPASATAQPPPSSVLSYTDPLISFLLSLYTDFSFSAAHAHLQQVRVLLSHDYFLAGAAEREILENARVMLFETYCTIHSRVEIARLQKEVDLTKEVRVDKDGEIIIESEEEEKKRAAQAEAEGAAGAATAGGMTGDDSVLVSLLRACHVNGRIDSYHGHLLMLGDVPSVYQQVIDRTKSAAYRSTQLSQQLQKRYKAKKEAQGAVVATED